MFNVPKANTVPLRELLPRTTAPSARLVITKTDQAKHFVFLVSRALSVPQMGKHRVWPAMEIRIQSSPVKRVVKLVQLDGQVVRKQKPVVHSAIWAKPLRLLPAVCANLVALACIPIHGLRELVLFAQTTLLVWQWVRPVRLNANNAKKKEPRVLSLVPPTKPLANAEEASITVLLLKTPVLRKKTNAFRARRGRIVPLTMD